VGCPQSATDYPDYAILTAHWVILTQLISLCVYRQGLFQPVLPVIYRISGGFPLGYLPVCPVNWSMGISISWAGNGKFGEINLKFGYDFEGDVRGNVVFDMDPGYFTDPPSPTGSTTEYSLTEAQPAGSGISAGAEYLYAIPFGSSSGFWRGTLCLVFPLSLRHNQRHGEPMTLTVDLIDSSALKLLHDLEGLNLIRVNSTEEVAAAPQGCLSKRFAGALCLSAERYASFQSALQEGRSEWERDTY
jgi:hypothetical protein